LLQKVFWGFLFFSVLFFAGCRHVDRGQLFRKEARMLDVPIPLGAKLVDLAQCGESECSFSVVISREAVSDFYIQEMERYGWVLLASLSGSSSQLVFEKPRKLCVVTIVQRKGYKPKTLVTIMSGAKA
jgi:hypothetical protein